MYIAYVIYIIECLCDNTMLYKQTFTALLLKQEFSRQKFHRIAPCFRNPSQKWSEIEPRSENVSDQRRIANYLL